MNAVPADGNFLCVSTTVMNSDAHSSDMQPILSVDIRAPMSDSPYPINYFSLLDIIWRSYCK